jgi:radical SAM-linked protein
MELLSMAFVRSALPIVYTKGFNPLPVLEIVSPLAVGISSSNELAMVELESETEPQVFLEKMNSCLISGIRINRAAGITIPFGTKKHSLSSWLWGSSYINSSITDKPDYVPFKEEKKYRLDKIAQDGSLWGLRRVEVLAKAPGTENNNFDKGISFFYTFEYLYPHN